MLRIFYDTAADFALEDALRDNDDHALRISAPAGAKAPALAADFPPLHCSPRRSAAEARGPADAFAIFTSGSSPASRLEVRRTASGWQAEVFISGLMRHLIFALLPLLPLAASVLDLYRGRPLTGGQLAVSGVFILLFALPVFFCTFPWLCTALRERRTLQRFWMRWKKNGNGA